MEADTVLRCHCGFEARGEDEHELVAEVQRHAWEAHQMSLSRQEALVLAFRVGLEENAPPAEPRPKTTGGGTT